VRTAASLPRRALPPSARGPPLHPDTGARRAPCAAAGPARLRVRQQLDAALRGAAEPGQTLAQEALGLGLGQAEQLRVGRVQRAQRGQRHDAALAAASHQVEGLARGADSAMVSACMTWH